MIRCVIIKIGYRIILNMEVIDLKWVKENIKKFFRGRYGIDELGKVLIWINLILYVLGMSLKNMILLFLSLVGTIVFFYRFFSRQTFERSEENCKFMQYTKSWKLKYEYRKTARIYMCPQCGKMLRVPKGKGKIQITCPNCSHSIIRYS
jgi:DNA-directed RNA polymerase subunit RPC12/RpoP